MNRYGQVLERVAQRTRIDPNSFFRLEDRRRRRQRNRRIVSAIVALVVAGGGALGAFALAGPGHVRPAAKPRMVTNTAQGITVSYPAGWTLVQLGNEPRLEKGSDQRQTWAALQLTNFSPPLDPSHLCPQTLEMPADGVLLYVQRDLQTGGPAGKAWPVPPGSSDVTDGACGPGHHVSWTVGDRHFEALIAFGPNAPARDRQAAVHAFQSLDFEWIRYQDTWVGYSVPSAWLAKDQAFVRALVRAPKEVLASRTSGGERYTFTAMPDPLDLFKGAGATLELEDGNIGPLEPPALGQFMIASRYFNHGLHTVVGSVTADVARVAAVIGGHTYQATLIDFPPNLAGGYRGYFFNLDGIAVQGGEIVARNAQGQVVQRLPLF